MPTRKVPVRPDDVEAWKREVVGSLVSLFDALSATLRQREDAYTLRELTTLDQECSTAIGKFVRQIEARL